MSEHVNTAGQHLLVEYTGCNSAVLDDPERLRELLIRAAEAARSVVVSSIVRIFDPQGVTGVVVLKESHVSIHTWPEHGYAAVDFFTCGRGVPGHAYHVLFDGLKAASAERLLVRRGLGAHRAMLVSMREVQRRPHQLLSKSIQ